MEKTSFWNKHRFKNGERIYAGLVKIPQKKKNKNSDMPFIFNPKSGGKQPVQSGETPMPAEVF